MAIARIPHKLKANRQSTYPKQIIFLDTETKPVNIDKETVEHRLKLGVYCYYQERGNKRTAHEDYYNFTSVSQFWDSMLSHATSNRRIVIIAHNLDFDFLVVNGLSELKSRHYYAQNLIISGNVDIWSFVQYKHPPDSQAWYDHVKKTGKKPRVVKTLLFLDFMNYFKTSLKMIGENIGLKKMDIDFTACSSEELRVYCHNDVKIMVKAWIKWVDFLDRHKLGVWGKTLPSQAFNAFRHRFMSHDIYIHSNEPVLQLERRAYHGGRTECFQLGKYDQGPYYLLDVNSLYPSVMQYRKYPTALISTSTYGTLQDIEQDINDCAMIADVLVESYRSVFPYRYEGRLIFPTGRFRTTLTTPELRQALDHREVKAVGYIATYEHQYIFAEYIDFFYRKRLSYKAVKDKSYDYITKLLMNALYGKFGQAIDRFTTIGLDPKHDLEFWSDWDAEDQEWLTFKKINGKVEVRTGREESYNSFPAIAAHVTAYARCLLHQLLQCVPRYSLFYCDTDSLIVDRRGYEAVKQFCHKTMIGALHLEKQSEAIEINSVKDYVFASTRKIKGVRKNAVQIDIDTFSQWQQVSLRSVIKTGGADTCRWKEVKKQLTGKYTKGIVYPDGLVLPFHFCESRL